MRALTEAERQQRRDELADRAAAVFAEVGYQRLTMEAVAKAAGVAKGTLFLSFASKEDLILHEAGRRFAAWFPRLERLNPSTPAPALAVAVAGTIAEDPLLMPLLGLVGPVLEQGCSEAAVVGFKEILAGGLAKITGVWSQARPSVPASVWGETFLRVYALIVGAWAVGEASDTVRGALANRPDLQPLLTRFEDLVVPLLEAQLSMLK